MSYIRQQRTLLTIFIS